MRRQVFTILAFFISAMALFSQNGLPYECKSGYLATKDSLDNMEFMMAMVISGEETPIYINLESGEADMWMYVYRDKADTTYNALYAVIKDSEGWFIFPAAENLELPEGSRPLDGVNFMGSDEFMNAIAKNEIFKEYISANPDPVEKQILLTFYPFGFDETIPEKYINQYLWLFMTTGIQCVTNALTGETDCELIPESDVKSNGSTAVELYPNPANDFFDISFDDNAPDKIEIFDVLGDKVKEFDGKINSISKKSVSDLNAGMYLVRLKFKDGQQIRKLHIVR